MELKFIIEAILFSAQKPMGTAELRDLLRKAAEFEDAPEAGAFKKVRLEEIEAVLAALKDEHEQAGRSYRLMDVAGAWQFVSRPEFAPWIKALVGQKPRPPKLSAPALETLAIIAYRQPITRVEVEQIRGVAVDGVMSTLLERGLIEQSGKAEAPGRPGLYSTTSLFLEHFGLGGLGDLPDAEELRRIPVKKPEELLTVDPGLATPAPEQLQLEPRESEEAPHTGGVQEGGAASNPVSNDSPHRAV